MKSILSECKKLETKLIEMRRELHKIPEIGGQLPKTRRFVCERLQELGIPYRLNEGDDGVVAEICGAKKGKTIAFRADMDALHANEENAAEYRSQHAGKMHGCGHDAHTAVLLSAAEILSGRKDRLAGRVRFLFQTGEETGTGAKQMIAEGALEGVDAIFALHVGALAGRDLPAGTLTVLPNAVSAGKDKFTITVHGKSTHSAFPALGIDPIRVAARIVVACEERMKKENANGTAVLSFGSVAAGEDHNTIPASALLKGSIRCQDEKHRSFLGKSLQEISEEIARSYGATCTVNLVKGSSTVVNDEGLALLAAGAIEAALGKEGLQTQTQSALMGSDDFANYLKKVKGVYFFLHTNNPEKGIMAFNHNAKFDIDEETLYRGVAATVAIAEKYLGGKENEE